MNVFYKVEISAETKEQAYQILNSLLDKRLVTGGQIINAPARFLWKGEVAEMDYFTINSFTTIKHKNVIINEVKTLSDEDVPMITFQRIVGNLELLQWIEETVEGSTTAR